MRTRLCKNCEKMFEVPTGRALYLCPECSKKSKADSVLRERTCKICGKHFLGYPRSFFCPECSAERKKQQSKSHRKTVRPIGSTDICAECGEPYIVNSGRQKYCPECAEKVVSEKIRTHKREYMAKNKEKSQKIKKDVNGKRYVCPICGKEFEKHGPETTCSSECAVEQKRIRQNKADLKRGKRKLPPEQKYDSGLPKSGVVGVTWRKNGKWQATYKGLYIGIYDTVEEAARAIEKLRYAKKNGK